MKHINTLIILFLLFFVPIIILVFISISPSWRFPDILPNEFSFKAFNFLIIQHKQILKAIWSSFCFSIATAVLTFFMCIVPAHIFARKKFYGKNFLEAMLLAPALVPSMTFSMGLHFIFIKISIADTFFGVVLILSIFSYPYMFRALIAGFQTIGTKYKTCALNLGSTKTSVLFKIEIPMLVPSIAAGASIVFLVAFSEYFLVFLIGGGNVLSFSGTLFPLLESSNRSLAAIYTLIFLFIPVLLFIILHIILTAVYEKKGLI